jgi:hypothetical protein
MDFNTPRMIIKQHRIAHDAASVYEIMRSKITRILAAVIRFTAMPMIIKICHPPGSIGMGMGFGFRFWIIASATGQRKDTQQNHS